MHHSKKLSIIIPVYNEQRTIAELLEKVCAIHLDGITKEIIVTDDGSSDDTAAIVSQAQKRHPEIAKVYTSLINLGKGAAIRFGMEFATGDVILIQDADLELDPSEYPMLIKPVLEGITNVVYGSRFKRHNNKIPFRTAMANRLLVLLTNLLYGSHLTDMATGYKIFRADVVRKFRLRSARFEFEPEITAKFLLAGEEIVEVPISYNPRSIDEGKRIGWIDGIEYIVTLFKYQFFDR